MAAAHMPGSAPAATGRAWTLRVLECSDGRLAIVAGLPDGRAERQELTTRLRDLLLAVQHADDVEGHGDAYLWARYCRAQFASLAAEFPATVEYMPAERELAGDGC